MSQGCGLHPVGFERTGGGGWKEWDRYLTLNGKPAYHIGNVCNTCAFFFERLEGANQSVSIDTLVDKLASGLVELSEEIVDLVVQILPAGEYVAILLEAKPTLVVPAGPDDYFFKEQITLWGVDAFWDLPHHPKTAYYRLDDTSKQRPALFEFLIPMFPARWLKDEDVARYSEAITLGAKPTALAVSVLDLKTPSDAEGDDGHLCLAHYLLDGHHKVRAAMQLRQPITVLSLLAVGQGTADAVHCEAVLKRLGGPPVRP